MPANLAKLRKIGHYTGRRNQTDPLDRTQMSNFFTVQAFSALTDQFFYRLNGFTQIVDMTLQRGFDCLRRRCLKPALVVISLLNKVFPLLDQCAQVVLFDTCDPAVSRFDNRCKLRQEARIYGVGFSLLSHCLGKRSEEHTSELQSLMRISYAVFCLKKKRKE